MNHEHPQDLWILGVGIRGVSQITLETLEAMKRCRVLFDLTHEHARMRELHPRVIDLDGRYWVDEEREDVYEALIRTILDEVARGPGVGLVSYGHPMVFDDVTLELVRRCRRQRLRCRVLPAVSCFDTLCIDLGLDFGDGFQIFEATQLVLERQRPSPKLHALILQLGEFDTSHIADRVGNRPGRFTPLVRHLQRFYPADHRAVIVFSADGSMSESTLLRTRISRLDSHRRSIFPGVSLYLPPV